MRIFDRFDHWNVFWDESSFVNMGYYGEIWRINKFTNWFWAWVPYVQLSYASKNRVVCGQRFVAIKMNTSDMSFFCSTFRIA